MWLVFSRLELSGGKGKVRKGSAPVSELSTKPLYPKWLFRDGHGWFPPKNSGSFTGRCLLKKKWAVDTVALLPHDARDCRTRGRLHGPTRTAILSPGVTILEFFHLLRFLNKKDCFRSYVKIYAIVLSLDPTLY